MKNFLISSLCCLIPFARVRHQLKKKGCCGVKIFVLENGKERLASYRERLRVKIKGTGIRNIIKIETPISKKLRVSISYYNSNDNCVIIHKDVWGSWNIGFNDFSNFVEVGENTHCSSVFISLIGNKLKFGKNCMVSRDIRIWGDGHSVLDYKTKAVLNKPVAPIVIGDHCWLGERVTLTKNAQIPDDCIVGIGSIVTKKFTEKHCVLAGVPAKVVKNGVTWHRASPGTYEKKAKEKKL